MKFYLMFMSILISANSFAANCIVDFEITDQWQDGFTTNIKITNNQSSVNDWRVSLNLPGNQEVQEFWNVLLTETTGAISGSNESYNGSVALNGVVEFGYRASFSGNPDNIQTAPDIRFNDELCDVAGQGGSVTDPGATDPGTANPGNSSGQSSYTLNNAQSLVSFVTTKKVTVTEPNRFDAISATIDGEGNVTISIDMNSVNTNIDLRDQNIKQYLFETATYPTAEITAKLENNAIANIAVGTSLQMQLPMSLTLHGVTQSLNSTLLVQRLSQTRLVVGTLKPLIINADDYGLMPGVEMLKGLANLTSISMAIPVDAQLVFDKQQ